MLKKGHIAIFRKTYIEPRILVLAGFSSPLLVGNRGNETLTVVTRLFSR